jgi:hypothetical protein
VGSLLKRLEAFASTPAAAPALFASALAVYALESIAVPVTAGRDLQTYIVNYLQLGDWKAAVPIWSLLRTPLASLSVGGPLELGGAWLAQAWLGLLFAASITAWTRTAVYFGGRAAFATAAVLLLDPGYSILFHQVGSDSVSAAAFSGLALLAVRASVRPSTRRFAEVGLGVGLATLVRPSNEPLVLLALLGLIAPTARRWKAGFAIAFIAAAAVPVVAWSANNRIRYHDFALVRGVNLVFGRAFLDGLVSPRNGPASAELARFVNERLLTKEPYRSYRITARLFWTEDHTYRMLIDLNVLSDSVWGWDSDYAILKRAGREAVVKHPGKFVAGVIGTLGWDLVSTVAAPIPLAPTAASPRQGAVASVEAGPEQLPPPTEGDAIPSSRESMMVSTPDDSIKEVWTSATVHNIVFKRGADTRRFGELNAETARLTSELPPYTGRASFIHRFDQAARAFPPAIVWLLAGLAAVGIRRPRGSGFLLILAGAAFVALLAIATGVGETVGEYVVPFVPAFVLLTTAGLLGSRGCAAVEAKRGR